MTTIPAEGVEPVKLDAKAREVLGIIDGWMDGYDFMGTGSVKSEAMEREEWAKDRERITAYLSALSPVSPSPAIEHDDMLDEVWNAVLSAPHTITADEIVIRQSDRKYGNAAYQLRERLRQVLLASSPIAPRTSEPPAVALLRGRLSSRATSAEFNEWDARSVVNYIDQLRATAQPDTLREKLEDLLNAVDAVLDPLGPDGYLGETGAPKTNALRKARGKARAALKDSHHD